MAAFKIYIINQLFFTNKSMVLTRKVGFIHGLIAMCFFVNRQHFGLVMLKYRTLQRDSDLIVIF